MPVTGNKLPSAPVLALTTGAIVVVGKWAAGDKLTVKIAIGTAFYAVGLSLMAEFTPEIAAGVGTIALVTVAFMYVPKIGKAIPK